MAEAPKKSAVVTVRAKKAVYFPPAELGFADLLVAKAFGDNPAKFGMDAHYRPEAFPLITGLIDTKCYAPQLEELYEEVIKNGGRKKDPISSEEWLEGQLKTHDRFPKRNQLPFIKIRREGATRKGPIMMGCWAPDGTPLDMAKLRMGHGTVIQPAVFLNVFASKAANWVPTPSLKLVGIKVLQLKQFGGSGGPVAPDADDEAIKKVMGGGFNSDTDFSQFAIGAEVEHDHDQDDDDAVRSQF